MLVMNVFFYDGYFNTGYTYHYNCILFVNKTDNKIHFS